MRGLGDEEREGVEAESEGNTKKTYSHKHECRYKGVADHRIIKMTNRDNVVGGRILREMIGSRMEITHRQRWCGKEDNSPHSVGRRIPIQTSGPRMKITNRQKASAQPLLDSGTIFFITGCLCMNELPLPSGACSTICFRYWPL
jgi:hypothetical protein